MRVNTVLRRDTAQARSRETGDLTDERVYISLHRLLRLQHQATGFTFLPRQPLHSLLAGRHASRVRGRGLNFEEIRAYQRGDDIRHIDWKVTARTRQAHTRVFTEEKERPALLLVDQRLNMFFGTRMNMKSVTAAEAAALGAWRVLASGDRVGALIFDDAEIIEIKPQRSRANVMRILESVVIKNHALRADLRVPAGHEMLDRALEAADRLLRHDALITVISDFDGAGDPTRRLLSRLKAHNDVIGLLVHDPSALELPARRRFVISDGELQAELDLGAEKVRRNVAEIASGRIAYVLGWQREIGVPMLPINTAEVVATQVRQLLGHARGVG